MVGDSTDDRLANDTSFGFTPLDPQNPSADFPAVIFFGAVYAQAAGTVSFDSKTLKDGAF